MSEVFEFPWERAAMRGDEMPEGLSLPDQLAYTALRNVYHAYYNKIISRDAAADNSPSIRTPFPAFASRIASCPNRYSPVPGTFKSTAGI